jgi:hypothetical protein
VAEVLHSQCFAVLERAGGADRVQAAEQLAEAIELVEVARLRRTAAAAGNSKAEALVFEQGAASCCSGATTGTSQSASSAVKACSSRMAASLQRPGR